MATAHVACGALCLVTGGMASVIVVPAAGGAREAQARPVEKMATAPDRVSPYRRSMKATVETFDGPDSTARPSLALPGAAEKSLAAVLGELFKVRLTTLVLLTTMAGFYLGSRGPVSWPLMLNTLVGTALLACGARRP